MKFYRKNINFSFLNLPFFTIMLFLELAVFIFVGQIIGVFFTLFLVALSMLIGIILLRNQSFALLSNFYEKLRQEDFNLENIQQNLIMILAGILFIIPGFISDIFALALCFHKTRRYIFCFISYYFKQQKTTKRHSQENIIDLDKEDYKEHKHNKTPIDFKDFL